MGGLILIFLVAGIVVLLLTPALRARARAQRLKEYDQAHEAIVKRLDDHRKKRQPSDDIIDR
jgi:hypothetical protein